MDDSFLTDWREDPPPEFAAELRARLHKVPTQTTAAPARGWWPARTLAWAAALAIVAALFAVPAVRASAHAFLSLFRAVNFVAVPVSTDRVGQLETLDILHLLSDDVTVLTDSGPPLTMTSLDQASASAGLRAQAPAMLPAGLALTNIILGGESAVRLTADVTRLQHLLEALGIDDVTIPPGINGQQVTIRVPPQIELNYDGPGAAFAHLRLTQSAHPTVALPPSLSLAALGEIGLRVLGMTAPEARGLAGKIDWRSTLLVPIPQNAHQFHDVHIGTSNGMAIQVPRRRGTDGKLRDSANMIVWSTPERVFVLQGRNVAMEHMLEMANSVR